jgi:hypothetical protein
MLAATFFVAWGGGAAAQKNRPQAAPRAINFENS